MCKQKQQMKQSGLHNNQMGSNRRKTQYHHQKVGKINNLVVVLFSYFGCTNIILAVWWSKGAKTKQTNDCHLFKDFCPGIRLLYID